MSKRKFERTSTNTLKFATSFFGSLENLDLLEIAFSNKQIITLRQYTNYVSLVAFTVELGMKTIILNEEDIYAIHDIEELYNKMPTVFHVMFEKYYTNEAIYNFLQRVKNIYPEFRYMETANIPFFTDKIIDMSNGNIDFTKIADNKYFIFLRTLLDEVVKLHKAIYKLVDISKLENREDETASMEAMEIVHEELNKIQTSLYVAEKE